MRAWALWAAGSGVYDSPALLEVFAVQAEAELTRDHLFGMRRDRLALTWVWEDDEDFPDLYVRPIVIR